MSQENPWIGSHEFTLELRGVYSERQIFHCFLSTTHVFQDCFYQATFMGDHGAFMVPSWCLHVSAMHMVSSCLVHGSSVPNLHEWAYAIDTEQCQWSSAEFPKLYRPMPMEQSSGRRTDHIRIDYDSSEKPNITNFVLFYPDRMDLNRNQTNVLKVIMKLVPQNWAKLQPRARTTASQNAFIQEMYHMYSESVRRHLFTVKHTPTQIPDGRSLPCRRFLQFSETKIFFCVIDSAYYNLADLYFWCCSKVLTSPHYISITATHPSSIRLILLDPSRKQGKIHLMLTWESPFREKPASAAKYWPKFKVVKKLLSEFRVRSSLVWQLPGLLVAASRRTASTKICRSTICLSVVTMLNRAMRLELCHEIM